MISPAILLVGLNFLIGALAFYNFYYKRKNFPPGPIPLPLIGNLLSVMRQPPGEDVFIRWSREYGPTFTFWLGEIPVVFVTDFQAITESFQKDGETYAGRLIFHEMNDLTRDGTRGVIFTEGDLWREHRRFALHVFRDFGVSKTIMQDKVLMEISARFEKLNERIESDHSEICMGDIIDISVGSIINSLLFGYRFDEEHEKQFFELKGLLSTVVKRVSTFQFHIINWKPYIFRNLPGFRAHFERFKKNIQGLFDFYREQIRNHKTTLDENGQPTDFAEAFLAEAARLERLGTTDHTFTNQQLVSMCSDLWTAGQETTSTTLTWGVAYLIHHPEVQAEMQKELDTVIGTMDRFVMLEDRPRLPYTCAVINEIQRLVNLLPMNIPHKTTKDTIVGGYFLPKGTAVSPQLSVVLYNEKHFPNPKEFNPKRFLTEDGQLKKCDELIPFSVGKRQCLGEPLARLELFSFVTNIFNQYKLSSGKELPSLKRSLGVAVQCPRFTCKVERRQPLNVPHNEK